MAQHVTQKKNDATATADEIKYSNLLGPKLRAAAFGEIMSVLLQSPRHGKVTLETIARQMAPAFLTDQYVLAKVQQDNSDVPPTAVGVVFWASVSDEVDQRLQADLEKPIEIGADEWKSGDVIWILDIVAAPKVSASILQSVRERVGTDKTIRVRTADSEGKLCIKTLD